jgi:predicted transposase YdaD
LASKRALRRRNCDRKTHYDSRDRALDVKHLLPFGGQLDAYRCQFCGGWVLGHRPGYYRDNINKRVMRGDTA